MKWCTSFFLGAFAMALAGCQSTFNNWRVGDECSDQRNVLEGFTTLFGTTIGRDPAPVYDVDGYFRTLRNRGDRDFLIKTVAMDLADENTNIDRLTDAFKALRDCRKQLADQIDANLSAGDIDQHEAVSDLENLRASVRRDLALADALEAKIVSRGKVFRHATSKLAKIGPITAQPRIPVERSELLADHDSRALENPSSDPTGPQTKQSTVAHLVALGEINHAKRELLVHEIAKANRGLLQTGSPKTYQ